MAAWTRYVLALAILAWCVTVPGVRVTHAENNEKTAITVFAAASLQTTLDALCAGYLKSAGIPVIVAYAASSALAKQIEQAGPADVFISADLDWMDYLAQKSLIKAGSRINLVGNTLVLITPAASPKQASLHGFELDEALGNGKLAMADVQAVPAGKYGKAALIKLGLWDAVEPKVAQAENVRAALALVAHGEAPLGIVYLSDARAEPRVSVLATFPEETHMPIVYPLAILAQAKNVDGAQAFAKFLLSRDAQARFAKDGFKLLH